MVVLNKSLREKCPNTEFVCSVFFRIWTEYTISPNAGKKGLEKTPYLDTFHALK